MAREKLTAPPAGVGLVRKLAAEGDRIFSTDRAREVAPSVGLSEAYLRQAIHHLIRAGWLVRIRKGLYAICSSLAGVSPVHEFEIAMALVEPATISHCCCSSGTHARVLQPPGSTERCRRRASPSGRGR